MKDERLIKIAEQIYKLEKECQYGNNIQKNMLEIEQLTSHLSLEEMLIIDIYITEKNFLTK